jgi:hypothetical protein
MMNPCHNPSTPGKVDGIFRSHNHANMDGDIPGAAHLVSFVFVAWGMENSLNQ